MATYHPVTTSSRADFPTDAETIEALQMICDDYVFGTGPLDETTAEVREGATGQYCLYIGGHAEFDPVVRKDEFPGYDPVSGEAEEYWTDTRCQVDQETTVEFLQRLSHHLNEPLTIRTVGSTKTRWPATAYQYRVEPDGQVTFSRLTAEGAEETMYQPAVLPAPKPEVAGKVASA